MINTLYQMGNDALKNQGRVVISPISPLSEMLQALQFRITTLPSIPEYKIEYNEFSYKGYKVSLAKPGESLDRSASFTFRVDKYWKVYKALRAWGELIYNHAIDDAGLGDSEAVRTSIEIIVDNGPHWVFTGCIFESLDGIDLDNTDDGTPIDCTFHFKYLGVAMVQDPAIVASAQ